MQNLYNIDMIIFVLFLLVNLAIGFYYSRNINTIQDYALGGRSFSTGVLVSGLIATWVSGSGFITDIYNTYSQGFYFTLPNVGAIFALLIVSYVLAHRMGGFLGKLSIAEAMGSLYGKEVRVITAITGTIVAIGYVARQIKVSSIILGYFFDINSLYAVIFGSTAVITYAAYGGVKAITFTDVLQFCCFSIFIPIVTLMIWQSFQDPTPVIKMLSENQKYSIVGILDYQNSKFINTITLMIFFSFSFMDAANFQRISMCKNTAQIKRVFLICAGVLCAIKISLYWIGILLSANGVELQQNAIIPYMVDTYSYPWIKVFMLLGLMSMIMSTADAHINSATVLLSYDIKEVLNIKWLNSINDVKLSRFMSVLIGVGGIILALVTDNLLSLLLLIAGFYMPIVTVPFVFNALGFYTNKMTVLVGMGAGLFIVIIWRLYFMDSTGINSVVPGMFANLCVLIIGHYYCKINGCRATNKI